MAAETLPVSYGYLYGRLVLVGGNASTTDDKPDAMPATGTVTATPLTPVVQVTSPSPGVIGVQNIVSYTLDATGVIVDGAGLSPVSLIVGQYRLSYKLDGATLASNTINVTADNTKDAPLDLAKVYPLQPSPAVKFVVNEQLYTDTVAARDAAEQSATDAAASASAAAAVSGEMVVSGIVQGDDLILSHKDGSTVDAGNVRGAPGVVQGIVAGANVTVDSTDPAHPVVSASGGGGGAVSSVNGQTGDVTLDAASVGAYAEPAGGIPKTDMTSDVQASLGKADTALQAAPVTRVNGKTGDVTLVASDVGASPAGAYVKPAGGIPGTDLTGAAQSELTAASTAVQGITAGTNVTIDNTDPKHPVVSASGGGSGAVSSVNGKTGAVTLVASDVGAMTRNARVFNVRDYGATGDGATDDTTAIQAAVTALKTATVGVLYFPTGSYKITSTIDLQAKTLSAEEHALTYAVRGDGSSATSLLYSGSGPCVKVTDPAFDANHATLGSSVWEGFAIDGTAAAAGASGIQFGDVSGGKFVDLTIQNFTGTGSAGILFQNTTGWTEKMHTRDVRVGNCSSLLKFRNSGPYASWMYWDVDFDLYPFLNQIAIDDDPTQSTHDGSHWHVTANSAAGDGNTAVFLNMPANNSWWSVTWDFAGEVYGSGPAIDTINMTTAGKFFGFGKFHAYFMGNSTIPTPLGWYFGFVGSLALPGITTVNGEEDVGVLGPVMRLVQAQPSAPNDYSLAASGSSTQNTSGSDILVIVPWSSTASAGTLKFAGPSTATIGAAGQVVGGGASGAEGALTYMHPANQFVRLDMSNVTLGTPILTVI